MNGGGSARAIGDGSDALLENPVEGYFTLLDYGLFLSMLAVSGLIGLYYGFFSKRKQDNPTEYILGNQEMSVLPVAASMIVSHIAGVTMLALPADVYANGTQYVMSFISIFIVGASLVYIYIPVFYDLGFTSCFTYLEKRFDKRVKLTASLVYTLDCILSTPIVIYVPALAFNQVSGINVHYITVATCALCIFYTTIGGLRAVVWTDTIQFVSIIGAVVAVMCIGTMSQGGIWNVFEAAERGGRLIFFNLDPNPVSKSTFWSVTLGLTMMWISQKSASQSTIQRCLSLPDQNKAKRCVWIFSAGVSLIKIASCYVGILLYAKYEDCDPYFSGITQKLDQILPYYAMSIAKHLPGLTGLFIAGIFAAALSTMSSTLNSLAGTIFEDLIKPLSGKLGAKATSNVMKVTVVCIGAVVVALVFVVEQLGAILHLAYSLHGLTAGALVGIFTMGMLSPHINTKGIISGAVASLLCVGTIMVGAQFSPKPPTLLFRTDGCTFPVTRNSTAIWLQSKEAFDEVPWIFRISFMYYALIGAITVAIVSYPVSLATGGCSEEVDEQLLATFIRRKVKDNVKYKTVELTPVNKD